MILPTSQALPAVSPVLSHNIWLVPSTVPVSSLSTSEEQGGVNVPALLGLIGKVNAMIEALCRETRHQEFKYPLLLGTSAKN